MTTVAIKEKPILFSGPMVRALLDGRKTQTRRIVKDKHIDFQGSGGRDGADWNNPSCWGYEDSQGYWYSLKSDGAADTFQIQCPHGSVGERLWVRETWYYVGGDEYLYQRDPGAVAYRAAETLDRAQVKWRPSIFMPRWASRITLEITDVRAERLNDIREEDAIAEGSQCAGVPASLTNRGAFAKPWESINGPGSWGQNPWVWAITFKRLGPQ